MTPQEKAERSVKAQGQNARALILLFAAMELELTNLATEALTSGRLAEMRSRNRLRAQAGKLINRLATDYRKRLREVIEAAYGDGARLAGARPRSQITRAAISALVDESVTRLDTSLSTVGRQVDDIFRRVGIQQAARQITQELPERAAAGLVERDLRRRGLTGFVDSAGRQWKLSTYAQLVIRTTTAEAVAQGTSDAVIAAGRDLVRISDHTCDHHPSDPEHPCRELEGKTFSLTGVTPDFPRLPLLPPFHPNCRHVMAPAPHPERVRVPVEPTPAEVPALVSA